MKEQPPIGSEHLLIRSTPTQARTPGHASPVGAGGLLCSARGAVTKVVVHSTVERLFAEITAEAVLNFEKGFVPMSIHSFCLHRAGLEPGRLPTHTRKNFPAPPPFRFPAYTEERDAANRQAELFYLQKQIQSKTPMVIVLEDGERVDGCIEWYDRISLKVRGRTKTLVYKSAIKYMYKLGDNG